MPELRTGKMLDSVTAFGAGSSAGPAKDSKRTFQATVIATSGAMNAVMTVQVSNDDTNFLDLTTFTFTGVDTQSDGLAVDARWAFWRGNFVSATGSSTYTATLTVAEV